jgi:hypothetical protein
MMWVLTAIGLVAVVDMVRRPESDWSEADRDKWTWVVLGVLLAPIIWLAYLVFVMPRFPRVSTIETKFLK